MYRDDQPPIYKYHTEVNHKLVHDSDSYAYLGCDLDDGFIDLRSIMIALASFKSKKVRDSIKRDQDLINIIQNNLIINDPNYLFCVSDYFDTRHEYIFNKNSTTVTTIYLISDMLQNINTQTIDLKQEYQRFDRSTKFCIVNKIQSTNKQLVYGIASLKQILKDKIPTFKTIKAQETKTTNNIDLFNIGHINCKIANKVYYLYEFNTIFTQFSIKMLKDDIDEGIEAYLIKKPDNYCTFNAQYDLDKIINNEFRNYFGNMFTSSDFMHAFVSYSKIFAKVYVYTFLQNKSIDEIKATIQDIFKSMKETS